MRGYQRTVVFLRTPEHKVFDEACFILKRDALIANTTKIDMITEAEKLIEAHSITEKKQKMIEEMTEEMTEEQKQKQEKRKKAGKNRRANAPLRFFLPFVLGGACSAAVLLLLL